MDQQDRRNQPTFGRFAHVKSKVDSGLGMSPRSAPSRLHTLTKSEDASRVLPHAAEVAALRCILGEHEKFVGHLSAQLQQSTCELAVAKAATGEIQSQSRKTLRNSLSAFENSIDAVHVAHEAQLQALRVPLEDSVKTLTVLLQSAKTELADKASLIRKLEDDLDLSRSAREGLLKTLSELSEKHGDDMTDLSACLTAVLARNKELEQDLNTLTLDIDKRDFVRDSNAIQMKQLKAQNSNYLSELNLVKTSFSALKTRYQELEAKLEATSVECQDAEVSVQNTVSFLSSSPKPFLEDGACQIKIDAFDLSMHEVGCQTKFDTLELSRINDDPSSAPSVSQDENKSDNTLGSAVPTKETRQEYPEEFTINQPSSGSPNVTLVLARNKELEKALNTLTLDIDKMDFVRDSNAIQMKQLMGQNSNYMSELNLVKTSFSALKTRYQELEAKLEATSVECQDAEVSVQNAVSFLSSSPKPFLEDGACHIKIDAFDLSMHEVGCQTKFDTLELSRINDDPSSAPSVSQDENKSDNTLGSAVPTKETRQEYPEEFAINKPSSGSSNVTLGNPNDDLIRQQEVEVFLETKERLVVINRCLRSRFSELESNFHELKRERIHLRIKHRMELRELKEKVTEKEQTVNKLQNQLKHLNSVEETLVCHQQIIHEKDKELNEAQSTIDKLVRDSRRQQTAYIQLKEAAVLLEEMADETEASLRAKTNELEALRRSCDEQTQETTSLRNDLKMIRLEHLEGTTTNAELRSQAMMLRAQIESLKTTIREYQSEVTNFRSKNRKLAEEIAKEGKKAEAMQKQKEYWLDSNVKLRSEASARLAECSVAEAKNDIACNQLLVAQQRCQLLEEALAKEQAGLKITKRTAITKERELLDRLSQMVTICDKLRHDLEQQQPSKLKKTITEKLFGTDKKSMTSKCPLFQQRNLTPSRQRTFTLPSSTPGVLEPLVEKYDTITTSEMHTVRVRRIPESSMKENSEPFYTQLTQLENQS